jgi:hypothetical protein
MDALELCGHPGWACAGGIRLGRGCVVTWSSFMSNVMPVRSGLFAASTQTFPGCRSWSSDRTIREHFPTDGEIVISSR